MPFTTKQAETMELQHKYGGNGYALLDAGEDEYCRVIELSRGNIGSRVFVVLKKLCAPFVFEQTDPETKEVKRISSLLTEKQKEEILQLRTRLKAGSSKIQNGFVAALK